MPAQRVSSTAKDAATHVAGVTARVPSADAPAPGTPGADGVGKDQD
jgi:hypothetical protein